MRRRAPRNGSPSRGAGRRQPPIIKAQLLTVTSEGVWIDGERADVEAREPASTTLFFKPEGAGGGHVEASWCELPAGAPAGTPTCQHELPEALPDRLLAQHRLGRARSPFGRTRDHRRCPKA